MSKQVRVYCFCILFVCVSVLLEKFGLTIFLPGMATSHAGFAITRAEQQMCLPIVLLGITVSQFFSGYSADRFGRRKLLMLLLVIYMLGALISASAQGWFVLLLGMLIQGFGLGGVYSLSQSLVKTVFAYSATKVLSYIMMFLSFSSFFGLLLGAYLDAIFNWRGSFYFLFFLAALLLLLIFTLPKSVDSSSSEEKPIEKPVGMMATYKSIYSNLNFLKYALTICFLNAAFMVFMTISPFLVIRDLHYSKPQYAYMMLLPITGLFLGRMLSGMLSGKLEKNKVIQIANSLALIASVVMFLISIEKTSAWLIMGVMMFLTMGIGLNSPNSRIAAMSVMGSFAASCASLLSVTVNFSSAIHSYLAAHLEDQFMTTLIMIICLINVVCFLILHRKTQAVRNESLSS